LIFSIYSFYYLFFCSQTFFPKKSHWDLRDLLSPFLLLKHENWSQES
jgi:hypothetical protein